MSRRDDDLRTLLTELERTLDELDAALREERSRRRPTPPSPPTPGDLLRFAGRYTVPALIAVLEAAVRSLRLFRRLLGAAERTANPVGREGRSARTPGGPPREEASAGLAAALSELRAALDAADLPPDSEARLLVREARDLTAEAERRLDASRRERVGDRDRRRRGRPRRAGDRHGVAIEVTEEPADATTDGDSGDASSTADRDRGTEIDVEAELESIKDEVNGPRAERGEAERGDAVDDAGAADADGDGTSKPDGAEDADERSADTNGVEGADGEGGDR